MTRKETPNDEDRKVVKFKSKPSPHDAAIEDEDIQVACRRIAKMWGFKGPVELLESFASHFPSFPTYVVIGEYPNGEKGALLVEGESEQAASQLLKEYLSALKKGATQVPDDPCGRFFSPQQFWPCLGLRLLTRLEVDSIVQNLKES